jgi:hypothetical protein
MSSWTAHAFVLVTAIALYYLKWPILIVAAIIMLIKGWLSLCYRYPRTMFFITAFLRGLFSRR